jgi:hypothetical protein
VVSAISMGKITEEEFDLPIEYLSGRCFPQVTCFLPSEFCSKMYFGLFLLQCSLPSAKRSYYSFKLMSVRAFTRFAIGPIGRLTEPAE